MAVPRVSRMVTKRQKLFEALAAFVRTYRDEVSAALGFLMQDDDGRPAFDLQKAWTLVLDRLMRRLKNALGDLIEAERAHLDEVGNDAGPRKRRDQASQDLRRVLFNLRYVFRGVYGVDRTAALGFERRIAPEPLPLLRQGHRVLSSLEEPKVVGMVVGTAPPSDLDAFGVTPEAAALVLEPRITELRDAVDSVSEERGKVQGTKVAKDLAMHVFDETYLLIVRMVVPAFRLAGRTELAERIPKSLRRSTKRSR